MFYYVPLESYPERYTMQLSAPKVGWLEKKLIDNNIPYKRVDSSLGWNPEEINTGLVLDIKRRVMHSFRQVEQIVSGIVNGHITSNDVIYFEDFWTPGIEAIPYACEQMKVFPSLYAFCHAQSVDEFDFTYQMRHWMRPFEIGISKILRGIFVSCPTLKDLLLHGGVEGCGIWPVGHVWDSSEVYTRFPTLYKETLADESYSKEGNIKNLPYKRNQVVFSSRWDREKNPEFFLHVASKVKAVRPDIEFIVCSPKKKIISNDPSLLVELNKSVERKTVTLLEGLTKEQYYEVLCQSKVQFNCSSQDFVSYVLLEGAAAGCYPLYPYFRCFPEVLRWDMAYLYGHLDSNDAANRILKVLDPKSPRQHWSPFCIEERSWIHERFDSTWHRMAYIMGITKEQPQVLDVYRSLPWGQQHGEMQRSEA